MQIIQILAKELAIRPQQAEAAVKLIDEGNTIPFIARYRKEATGSLNDEVLRDLYDRLNYLRGLEDRKTQVLGAIEELGKLTGELKAKILAAPTLVVVEDLYRPYKQKRRTRATIAVEKGLSGLADLVLLQETRRPLDEEAKAYLSQEKGVGTTEEAIGGACDILAERISDEAEYRDWIRKRTTRLGRVVTAAKDKEAHSVYEMYYEFEEVIPKMAGHRVLAINRGEKEKFLGVKIEAPEEEILRYLETHVITRENPNTTEVLRRTIADAYKRLIAPAIDREIRAELTEQAEDGAIGVFKKNLEQLLMQPPLAGHTVLGWDPAFRTGCKLAVVDATGKVLDTAVVYPTMPTNEVKIRKAKDTVLSMIDTYGVDLISVGNGTASRESEAIIVDIIKEAKRGVSYVVTNEAGASVYSASRLATEEFPQFDVGQRSAASIARRVLDPLSELVKIDPASVGVGQYQHDMNQKKLGEALSGVVEDCVNKVGVDLNTASASLMEYISGISKAIAKSIVGYREANGRFTNRRQLLKVPKLGPKAYEQAAGFMRIAGGDNPLDATSVHPESYAATRQLLSLLGTTPEAMRDENTAVYIPHHSGDLERLAKSAGIGVPTLTDIIEALKKPGRDPRADLPRPVLRTDVLDMKDLKVGMTLKGTVRNVIDFGAFVDIGVHQDGLVHISELSDKKFVKHPLEVVSVGDIVEVRVISIDLAKKRIGLSMKAAK